MFSIIVLLHEYGHYKTAKIFGIHVEEFWLWIPPRAKKLWTNKDGTLFSLNWIPLGWFVKISGESEIFYEYFDKAGKKLSVSEIKKLVKTHGDIYSSDWKKISLAERKYMSSSLKNTVSGRNFYEKNIFAKTLVLLAWVIMNFVLAGIIFAGLFFVWVKPVWVNTVIPTNVQSKIIPTLEQAREIGLVQVNSGVLLFPTENSIAAESGILQWDILYTVNSREIESISQLQEIILENPSTALEFWLFTECNDTWNCPISWERMVTLTPNEEGKIWSYLSENLSVNEEFEYKYGVFNSIKYGFQETYSQSVLTLQGLWMLLKNIFAPETPEDREQALQQVAGPIGIVWVITQSLSGGLMLVLILWALISVNLWVFNLLPIPALDGGRILLLWMRSGIDAVVGKNATSGKIENFIHVFFFMTLIALSILIAYNDIIKLIFE